MPYFDQGHLPHWSHYVVVLVQAALQCGTGIIADGKFGYIAICFEGKVISGMSVKRK